MSDLHVGDLVQTGTIVKHRGFHAITLGDQIEPANTKAKWVLHHLSQCSDLDLLYSNKYDVFM